MSKEFWNEIYNKERTYPPINILLLENIFSFIEEKIQPSSVLEIGAGTGDLAVKLAKRGLVVTAIDVSSVALEEARKRAEQASVSINFIEDDVETTEARNVSGAPFDIVITKLTYAFIKDKERFLELVNNVLSPQGFFVLMTPVLYKNIDYDEHLRKISIDKTDTEILLKKYFKDVVVLNESFFAERGSDMTFIVQRQAD